MNIKKRINNNIIKMVYNDEIRKMYMLKWLNISLFFIALMMTIVNIFTQEVILGMATFLYSVLCFINLILMKYHSKKGITIFLFSMETMILLTFFLISGIPNGFSALWICLIPSFALIVFGKKQGFIYSVIVFIELIFLFWFPLGKQLLMYQYTNEFMLRFPFFYFACLLIDIFVETIRAKTQKLLLESEERYKYLYRHDALTGLYNRYGFNLKMKKILKRECFDRVGYLILDIDDFKAINDQYGHQVGDEILKMIVKIMKDSFCEHTIYCRWGGEEFTAFLHCQHDYLEYAEKLRHNIEKSLLRCDDHDIYVTVSIGLCIANHWDKHEMRELEILSDDCLYEAKKSGKNRVVSCIV